MLESRPAGVVALLLAWGGLQKGDEDLAELSARYPVRLERREGSLLGRAICVGRIGVQRLTGELYIKWGRGATPPNKGNRSR